MPKEHYEEVRQQLAILYTIRVHKRGEVLKHQKMTVFLYTGTFTYAYAFLPNPVSSKRGSIPSMVHVRLHY